MRRAPVAVAILALGLLVALATTTGSSASSRTAPHAAAAAVTDTQLACPYVDGGPGATSTRMAVADVARALTPPSQSRGTVTATLLAGRKSTTSTLHPAPAASIGSATGGSRTYGVAASGSVAATLVADQVLETTGGRFRALAGTRCEAPATDWWFTGAEGRVGFTDVLELANPTTNPAEVSLTLWGANGPQLNTRLEALRLPARTVMKVPVAAAAPNVASVAVHVHASSGAVTAAVMERRTHALSARGGDFIPPTAPPARSAVVAGYAAGNGPRYLLVTAPGGHDATVTLRLVTRSGTFSPAGANQLVVRAGHTRAVDLTGPMARAPGAVELTSDQPVVANGLSVTPSPGKSPDLMWLAATPPLAGPAGVATGREPDGGQTLLSLTAPRSAAQVRVSTPAGRTKTLSVPAGKTVTADVTATVRQGSGPSPFVVTPLGSAPVYGVRILSFAGAHGALVTAEPLIALPSAIRLPPVREDPAVAIR